MIKFVYYLAVKGALLIFYLLFKVEIIGRENFDPSKNYIVAANHNHWADPFVIGAFYPNIIRYIAKKEAFENKFVAKLLYWIGVFPVDREANDKGAIRHSMDILRSGQSMGIFPEGTRNKEFKPMPVKAGMAMFSAKTGVEILPATIVCSFKPFTKLTLIYHQPVKLIPSTETGKFTSKELEEISQDIVNKIYIEYNKHKNI